MATNQRLILHLRYPDSVSGSDPNPVSPWSPADATFLTRWTPAWEVTPDGCYLDLTGTGRLLGRGSDGPSRVCREARQLWGDLVGGAAPTLLAAKLASHLAASWSRTEVSRAGHCFTVAAGGVATFLAPFSLSVLQEQYPTAVRCLRRFGLRTLGDLQTVPRSLLVATLGTFGAQLAVVASGSRCRRLLGTRPTERIVVTAQLERPLAGSHLLTALRRALAVRAMLACGGGPADWQEWRLQTWWSGKAAGIVAAEGSGADRFDDWLRLIEDLWRRLPHRRCGLTSLQLVAGAARCKLAAQDGLFPADRKRQQLALVWQRSGRGSLPSLFLASEGLLEAWQISWTTPALPVSRPPLGEKRVAAQNRVGGSGLFPLLSSAESDRIGKSPSSRG
ncbi:MAG: hypothetical protein ABIF77_02985 [bacterium]